MATNLSTLRPSVWLERRDWPDGKTGMSLMDRLFNALDGAYPNRWRAAFPDQHAIDHWQDEWAQAFEDEGLSPRDVGVGRKACRRLYDWPPSIAEFLRACRPASTTTPEALFYRAQTEMQRRRDGQPDNWPSWGLFWAAASLGNDLLFGTFKGMEARWCVAMEANQHRTDAPEEAPKQIAVARISPAEAADRLREIGGKVRAIGAPASGIKLDWANRIAEQTARGQYAYASGQRMAAEAFVNLRQPVPPALVPFLPAVSATAAANEPGEEAA